VFLIQKKLERHFLYRAWTLVRALGYATGVILALRALVPAAMHSNWQLLKDLAENVWPLVVGWAVFEVVGEKYFTWFYSPRLKKPKKGDKAAAAAYAAAKRAPKPRTFYRRATVSHLLPGRLNPVLGGLSEQDMEFNPIFRAYVSFRYGVFCSVGVTTLLLIAAEPIPRQAIEGIVGATVPYFVLKAMESFLLYLFLGKVMSGEDIHGARTTRFFAFEPTASFQKRLTLPILDRKPWLVSLYAITNFWYRLAWWLYRLSFIALSVLVAQAAAKLKMTSPAVITPALAICLPAAIFYLGLVLERTMAYLIFFPKQKKKKKAKAETDIPMQKVG